MNTIWKFVVPLTDDDLPLLLPIGGRIVGVGLGGNSPSEVAFWYEFTEDQTYTEERTFRIFGTGHRIPPEYEHRGTVDLHPMIDLVWHLYEKIR